MAKVEVEIKNFQSMLHERVIIDGFSAVVGRSNIGKSAIVRAIKAALTGAPAESYVRHNADCTKRTKDTNTCKCFCSVRIKGDGLDLLWEKGDSVNRYVYNGVELSVPGRGAPEFLGAPFSLLPIGGDKTLLQVADQFEPPFLMRQSGTAVADVLSDVAKLDQINVASRLAEKDRKETAATRKVRLKDRDVVAKTLTKYDGLDDVLLRTRQLEALSDSIVVKEQELQKLERYVAVIESTVRDIKTLSPVTSLVVPEVAKLKTAQASLQELTRLEESLLSKSKVIAALDGVQDIKVPTVNVSATFSLYRDLTQWSARIAGLRPYLEAGKSLLAVSPPDLTLILHKLSAYEDITSWQDQLNLAVTTAKEVRQELDEVRAQEAEVLTAFSEMGTCPTCSQPVRAAGHTSHQEAVLNA